MKFMKLIERDFYLNKMVNVIGTPDIKIITGVRRSGKSKLLEAFKKFVEKNIKSSNIIHINFNTPTFDKLKNYNDLYKYINEKYLKGKKNFVLIDEIQMCETFEKALNWLHAEEKYDIYVTGSNAFLLSSDLATLFTGRTFKIEMYPFSFKEFLKYYKYQDIEEAFDKYFQEGGLAGSYLYDNIEEKYDYIEEVYNTLIVRDINQKYNIRNSQIMDSLNDFLMDNISNLTSARNIAKTISQDKTSKITDKTINNYLKYLCNAISSVKLKSFLLKQRIKRNHYEKE